MNQVALSGALEVGLIFGFVALGVYLSFRVLDFPDLTADGSFPLGAAVAAAGLMQGWNPWIATAAGALAGAVAGSATAFLSVRFKIMGLVAGILTMTALYSVNLRIMGKPNIALLGQPTVFGAFAETVPAPWGTVLGAGVMLAVTWIALSWFMGTQIGLSLRASGINARMARAQGVETGTMVYLGLALSNALVAAAGALFAQANGFADVTSGIGTIVIGLASIIVGESIFRSRKVPVLLAACMAGSIIYRLAVQGALSLELPWLQPSDLSLVTAILVAAALILPALRGLSAKRAAA